MNKSETQKYVKELQDKIVALEKECDELKRSRSEWIDNAATLSRRCENLEKQIAEMQTLSDRHQSDCIKINQLQTTIDVLIHKIEYLRQFAGLE